LSDIKIVCAIDRIADQTDTPEELLKDTRCLAFGASAIVAVASMFVTAQTGAASLDGILTENSAEGLHAHKISTPHTRDATERKHCSAQVDCSQKSEIGRDCLGISTQMCESKAIHHPERTP
jgi:hypothetical protein